MLHDCIYLHISPNVCAFIGSTWIRFLSLAYMTIMHQFSWLDKTRNFPVLSMYMRCFKSSLLILASIDWCGCEWTICVSASFLSWVDHTPWHHCHICSFGILCDSGKCFAMVIAVCISQDAKKPAFIAFSQVDLVGPCYCMIIVDHLVYAG